MSGYRGFYFDDYWIIWQAFPTFIISIISGLYLNCRNQIQLVLDTVLYCIRENTLVFIRIKKSLPAHHLTWNHLLSYHTMTALIPVLFCFRPKLVWLQSDNCPPLRQPDSLEWYYIEPQTLPDIQILIFLLNIFFEST